ncbi:DivIVA domain-containing protein [Clostridium sp. MSJ-11]|uniref:DivIVA domain-containing protein n=1 Tax=Clostridium mobile TaxID=2841512 RepID=A0ABS6ED83_9CLOT|nr:DivIVA domain-containing protein [Clostridium mobile]MBU5482975.1 DivIVA domain-containing protein [Clostridium mobile]
MKITAMDITGKEFKKGFRGYDMDEVDEFLEEVAENYETLYKENSATKEKVSLMEENLNHYRKMEETIQNTLLLAQNAADQSKKSAQQEAELIIRSANETSKKLLDKAHDDVIKINDEYEKVQNEFIIFKNKFKNFMQSQMEMFEDMEKDFMKKYNIGNIIDLEMPKEKEIDDLNKELSFDEKENIIEDIRNDSFEEIKNFFVEE